jgi:hypothetical protein
MSQRNQINWFPQQLLTAEIWCLVTSFIKVPHIVAFFDPSDSYFLFAEERGYHRWALAHSSSCFCQFTVYLYCEKLLYSDEKCAYMFNVYKNQLSRQTGSRNLTGPKTLPTIWYTYLMLVTKYQISAINSYWEKCDEKYLGRKDGQTDRGKTVYPPPPNRNWRIEV